MPLPEMDSAAYDAENLSHFVLWTHEVLRQIVHGETDFNAIPQELADPMRAAWEDVSPLFPGLASDAAEIHPDLAERHGLHGSQLHFKLATVRYWTGRVNRTGRANNARISRKIRRRRRNRGKWREFLGRLLIAIDTLLDSILKALGMGSSVKEVKDAIRDAIKDADDED